LVVTRVAPQEPHALLRQSADDGIVIGQPLAQYRLVGRLTVVRDPDYGIRPPLSFRRAQTLERLGATCVLIRLREADDAAEERKRAHCDLRPVHGLAPACSSIVIQLPWSGNVFGPTPKTCRSKESGRVGGRLCHRSPCLSASVTRSDCSDWRR